MKRARLFFLVFAIISLSRTKVAAQGCDCIGQDKSGFVKHLQNFNNDSINTYLALLEKKKSLPCLALFYNQSAFLSYRTFEFERAFFYLRKERAVRDELKCPELAYIDNFYLTGLIFSDQDMHDSAATYLLKALDLAEEKKHTEIIPKIYHSLAGVYAKLRDMDKSERYIRSAIKVNASSNNAYLLANNYSTLSSVFVALNKLSKVKADFLDSAATALEKSYELAKASNNRDAILSIYYKKATLLTNLKRFDLAEKYLDSSINLSNSLIHVKNLCGAYSHKAALYSKQKKYDEAIKYNDSSMKYCYKLGALSSLIGLQKFSYETYLLKQDFKNALRAHEKMMVLLDSLNVIEKTTKISELEKKYDQVKNEKTIIELSQKAEIDSLRIRSLIGFSGVAVLLIVIIVFFYRQSIIKNELKIIETEQRLNRARMNPHFFFNALASLQNLSLTEGKRDQVPSFISKFSKIMRQSLESTFNELDTVENEIAFLTDYLEIQKLRSESRFNYKFNVQDDMELNELLIPGMILQPFIENSIEHGFKNKMSEGLISVDFRLEKKNLKVSVEDNGSGPHGAGNKNAYPSRATQIVKDRLFLLNKKYKTNATFVISDAMSKEGFKVEIILPIIYKA